MTRYQEHIANWKETIIAPQIGPAMAIFFPENSCLKLGWGENTHQYWIMIEADTLQPYGIKIILKRL